MFFHQSVLAFKVRRVAQSILKEIDAVGTEIFPKQDRLTGHIHYGNFINAPLFGGLVRKHRTVFLDLDAYGTPYADQWEFLSKVKRISENKLDEVFVQVQDENIDDSDKCIPTAATASRDIVNTSFALPDVAVVAVSGL